MPATAAIQVGLSLRHTSVYSPALMNTGDGRLQPLSPIQLGYLMPLELNHVEAGEIIRSLRDPRQRMAVTQ